MNPRPFPLLIAASLLLVIGLTGLAAGGGLLGVALNTGSQSQGAADLGMAFGSMIAAYGFVTVLAGAALLLLRRWAWKLGIITVVIGMFTLGNAVVASELTIPVLGVGLGVWLATFVLLVLPATRAAVAPQAGPPRDPPSDARERP